MKSCFSVVVMSNTIQVALSKSISLSVISAPKDLAFPQIKFHWKPRSWWCGRLKHCCTNCFSIHFNEHNLGQLTLLPPWHSTHNSFQFASTDKNWLCAAFWMDGQALRTTIVDAFLHFLYLVFLS